MVHGLESEYWGRVDFVYIDREDPANEEIVWQYGVRYQPVFFLIDADGNIVSQWTVKNEDEMRAELDSLLASSES